jgi:hypothetical protein
MPSARKRVRKRVKPEIGTGAVRVVGSSPHKGNAEILKAEKLKSGPGIEAGIAQQGGAYYGHPHAGNAEG